jgi:hypothetical protein
MQKYYLIALIIIAILLGAGYISLFAKQVGIHKSLDTEANVFVLENINNANIKIITAKTDKITVDLKGSKDELDKVRFFKVNDDMSGFGLSKEWQNLTGTITVPEGTLLDIRLSDNANLTVKNPKKMRNIADVNAFLVDTNEADKISTDGNGDIFIDGWGDTIVWDSDNWGFFDGDEGGEGEGEENNEPASCSIGSQAIRNYCCERENQYEPTSSCSGDGQWVFNNSARLCEHKCYVGNKEQEADCSVGSQSVRNACCKQKSASDTIPECIGEWQFSNSIRSCVFHCYEEEELDEYFGGGNNGGDGEDKEEVLRFCEDFDTQQDKDECCDYNLKNELSIGPRPGFPDCIGRWYFNQEQGCAFRCADYDEMQKILKELRAKAQQEE